MQHCEAELLNQLQGELQLALGLRLGLGLGLGFGLWYSFDLQCLLRVPPLRRRLCLVADGAKCKRI
jgi:hypothetical protein